MDTIKKFSAKSFSFGLEDHLADLNMNVSDVGSFWKDGKEHIRIHFDNPKEDVKPFDLQIEISGIMETYTEADVWVPYSLSSAWENGGITVLITFNSEEENG